MAKSDWEIPPELQPDPSDFTCDIDRTLRAVVGIKSLVPEDAFTAATLGTEREGSGVLIQRDGLVLTVGYLITEAETVWLTTAEGRAVPGHALAVDFESGFGLVQALGRLEMPMLEFGEAAGPRIGATAMLGSAGGRKHAVGCTVVARQPFAGYWEYLLDDAIFTAPAHPSWGGAGLIAPDGKLLGVGSLVLEQTDKDGRRLDINMCVPIGRLLPVLDEVLSYGRRRAPARPWLGMYATEDDDGIVVASLAPRGPAETAGIRPGDRVREVGGTPVSELADLWRNVWASGQAGATVKLGLGRRDRKLEVAVTSADRVSFLKAPRMH